MSALKYGAHHAACFALSRGYAHKSAPGTARRLATECADCGKTIAVGELFVWSRNNANKGGGHRPKASNGAAPASVTDATPGPIPSDDDQGEGTDEDPAPASEPAAAPSVKLGTLERAIADAVLPYLVGKVRASVSESEISKVVRKCMADAAPATTVHVTRPDGTTHNAGVQHRQFPELLQIMASGVNVWITGAAGTGKTHAVHAAAKALGLAYRYSGAVGDAFALIGYNDAQGRYVRTQCREAFEHGGVFCLDEADACDANAILAVNAMLANGCAAFPDTMVERHAECQFVATANTWGGGATAEYVGRTRHDGAFLNRFVQFEWAIDENLETLITGDAVVSRRVQAIRARVAAKGLKHMVTPRQTLAARRMVAQGLPFERAIELACRASLASDVWSQVSR